MRAAALVILFALAGCAGTPSCPIGAPSQLVQLYFGRSIPGGGQVGAEDWRRFEEGTLAAAFPDGFTVTEARGRWRDPVANVVVDEPSVVVTVALPPAGDPSTVKRVAADYRERFRQQSVGVIALSACVAF